MKICKSLFLLSLLITTFSFELFGEPNKDEEIKLQIDKYIEPYLNVGGFSGSILIAKKGKIIFSQGYGMANYELRAPNTSNTKFHLASISKTFTGAAIMLLYERGLLNFNDPLTKFIPDYPNGDKITVHHLLTNTSGIANINNFPEYNDWSKFPHTVEDLIEKFKNKPLDFEPGSKGYTESNSNYNLLAYIIQKLSGQKYGEFLKQNIFDPLEMKDTGHHDRPESILENRATGYLPAGISGFENAPFMDWSVKTGNGSIYSTVDDLYKWDRALYTEKILKKATIEKMFNQSYGWFNSNRSDRKLVYMNGRQPGFQCEIHRYLDDDVFIAVLGNTYITTPSLIINDLAAITFGQPYQAPELSKPVKIDPGILDAYVGRYKFGPDFYAPNVVVKFEKKNEQLFSTSRGDNILIPQSETKFFDRSVWAMITFVKNEKGEVTHYLWRYGNQEFRAEKLADK